MSVVIATRITNKIITTTTMAEEGAKETKVVADNNLLNLAHLQETPPMDTATISKRRRTNPSGITTAGSNVKLKTKEKSRLIRVQEEIKANGSKLIKKKITIKTNKTNIRTTVSTTTLHLHQIIRKKRQSRTRVVIRGRPKKLNQLLYLRLRKTRDRGTTTLVATLIASL